MQRDRSANSHTAKRISGPQLPSMKENGKLASFRRVKVVYNKEPIPDFDEAHRRLEANPNDAEANAFFGLDMVRFAQDHNSEEFAENAIYYLEVAISTDKHNAEYWYLLGRAYMLRQSYPRTYDCLQQSYFIEPKSPSVWMSIGILYWKVNQYKDSLDALTRSIHLNPFHYEAWYNLGVLYDGCEEQHGDATDAFWRCDELESGLPEVRARLEAYEAYLEDSNKDLFNKHLIETMLETPLQRQYETAEQAKGENITLNPVYDGGVHEESENETEFSSEYEADSEGSDAEGL
ncbi:hypothetical protein LB507_010812 [Fusarium sp. FIESC RH6]|nr:hypothetical protein LB507_010812 [Fusarium sp. FIESC RH6]